MYPAAAILVNAALADTILIDSALVDTALTNPILINTAQAGVAVKAVNPVATQRRTFV